MVCAFDVKKHPAEQKPTAMVDLNVFKTPMEDVFQTLDESSEVIYIITEKRKETPRVRMISEIFIVSPASTQSQSMLVKLDISCRIASISTGLESPSQPCRRVNLYWFSQCGVPRGVGQMVDVL